MANPSVIQSIAAAARRTGADATALLATSLQESGGRYNAIGDQGTSFGPFQYHRGGALGSHTPSWAMSNAEIQDEANRFAQNQIHGGRGAAALQRPADPAGYAAGVQSKIPLARQLLAQYAGASAPPGTIPPAALAVGARNASLTGGVAASAPDETPQLRSNLLQSLLSQNAQIAGIRAPTLPQLPTPPPAPTVSVRQPGVGGLDVNIPLRSAAQPPPTMGRSAQHAVTLARQYLGTPYRWGGATPGGFDCSGLAQYIYARAGVRLPRTSEQQFRSGRPVTTSQLQAGDLVFFRGTDGPPTDVGHEGIYIGQGRFIHAPHTGDTVKISTLSDPYYQAHYAGARRVS